MLLYDINHTASPYTWYNSCQSHKLFVIQLLCSSAYRNDTASADRIFLPDLLDDFSAS
jgi:hypothetical protein